MNRYFKAIKGLLNLKKTNEELIGSIDIRSGNIENITINPINSDSTEISISASLNNDILEINLPDETINIKDNDDNIIDIITFPVYSDVSIDIDTYCEDATAVLKDTDGNVISTTIIDNGDTVDIEAPDATATLKDTDGNVISITDILSGDNADIIAPDWVRPFDWLPMPSVTSDEQKFVGLHAVIEDSDNFCAFRFTTSAGDYQVDWGDGTIETFASNVTAEHQYNFDTYDVGNTTLSTRGYKQAMIVVTPVSGNLLTCTFQLRYVTVPVQTTAYSSGFLDMIVSLPNATTGASIILGGTVIRHSYCERAQLLNIGACTSFNSLFREFRSLQTFSLPDTTQITITLSMFAFCIALKRVSLFNTENVTNMGTMFQSCQSLNSIPLFNTAKVTTMAFMLELCPSLQSVPLLDTAKVTAMNGMVQNCFTLNSIPPLSTASITPSAGTDFGLFANGSGSLNRCQMVFARTVTFLNCQLSRDAIVEIFTNLVDRSATTSANIDITGNWGASALSTADREIATDKNWTITG